MFRRRVALGVLALLGALPTGPAAAERQPSELREILAPRDSWRDLDDRDLEAVITAANDWYEELKREIPGTKPATLELFEDWIRLADRCRRDWEASSERLSPAEREVAIAVSDELYGGVWGGFWNTWDGFRKARSGTLFERKGVRRQVQSLEGSDDPAVQRAARDHLLWHLAAHRAYDVTFHLLVMGWVAANPRYWDSYRRYVDAHGQHFGYVSARDAQVKPRMVAEAFRGTRWFRTESDPFAAYPALSAARGAFERGKKLLAKGRREEARPVFASATGSLHDARRFGATRAEIRRVLEPFEPDLKAGKTPGEAKTFYEATLEAIADHLSSASGGRGASLSSLPEKTDAPEETPATDRLVERVVVRAKAGALNYRGYLFGEILILVEEVAGGDVLSATVDLAKQGKLLFREITKEISGSRYPEVRDLVREAIRSDANAEGVRYGRDAFALPPPQDPFLEESLAPVGDLSLTGAEDAIRKYGSAIFALPEVERGLLTKRHGKRLREELRAIDPPDLYADLGGEWATMRNPESGKGARERLEALLDLVEKKTSATYSYLQSAARFSGDSAPPLLNRAVGASAYNVLVALQRIDRLLEDEGLERFSDVANLLGGTPDAGKSASRLRSLRAHAADLAELSRAAHVAIRDRKRSPNGPTDKEYGELADALGNLAIVDAYRAGLYAARVAVAGGRDETLEKKFRSAVEEMEATLERLGREAPANGRQLYTRALIYGQIEGRLPGSRLREAAAADFCDAFSRLSGSPDPEDAELAARALERARKLAGPCGERRTEGDAPSNR